MGESGAVLVQAITPGRWHELDEVEGYVASLRADKPVNVKKWTQPGCRVRFRVAANPAVTRDGKRLGLLKEQEQLAWLSRQAQRGGFDIADAACTGSDRIDVRHGTGGARMTVTRVQFDGELIAREPAALHQMLKLGLGHAKALGLGLLSLAPR